LTAASGPWLLGGMVCASAIPLDLIPALPGAAIDIDITLGPVAPCGPDAAPTTLLTGLATRAEIGDGFVRVELPGRWAFECRATGATFDRRADIAPPRMTFLIQCLVLPMILALNHRIVLHAAALDFDPGTAIVVGEAFRGKSTLAAAAHAAGHRVMGDDVCVLHAREDRWWVDGCEPVIRLRQKVPDAGETLRGKAKIALPPGPTRPAGAIFLLEPRGGEQHIVRPISASDALMMLDRHILWTPLIERAIGAEAFFLDRMRLVQALRFLSLTQPDDANRVPETVTIMAATMEALR
jgi:hypothetical protein